MLKKNQKPKKPKQTKLKTEQDYQQLGHMLENIYQSGYIDRNSFYKTSFLKGILTGLGGAIGATVVLGLLLWILNFFDSVPLIGPLTEKLQDTVEVNN